MEPTLVSTAQKTQLFNHDEKWYGTFAEIGAGQEVARHFFLAGHASNTIAKTMSAYDMTFSDAIYGKGDRYVSRARLEKMLEHEFTLLNKRLENNGRNFFAFANTVATSSHKLKTPGHAWMGMRFQTEANGTVNEVVIHIQMKDHLRLQQQDILGILGVNLIFACSNYLDDTKRFINSLMDNLSPDRVEIDFISTSGENLCHIDNKFFALSLVDQGLTNAILFDEDGEAKQASDYLYGNPVLVQRGTFKPVTNTNIELLSNACKQISKQFGEESKTTLAMFEFTVKENQEDNVNFSDSLARINTINAAGFPVLVSNFPLFYQLKSYLRKHTSKNIAIVVGASMLGKLFDSKYYKNIEGGILSAFGLLFDEQTRMLVYPYKSEQTCITAGSFFPNKEIIEIYKYLLENERIVDIFDCDDVDTSIHSEYVRKMLAEKDDKWKNLVPESVCNLIIKNKLFGY